MIATRGPLKTTSPAVTRMRHEDAPIRNRVPMSKPRAPRGSRWEINSPLVYAPRHFCAVLAQ